MPFKVGQSGNPSGRPKRPNAYLVRQMAQQYTEEAINTLVAIMRAADTTPASRVRAAEAILERGWGKPEQPIVGEDGGPLHVAYRDMSDQELLLLLQAGSEVPAEPAHADPAAELRKRLAAEQSKP